MRALITGITGQDGRYLAQHLLARGDDVWGMHRWASRPPNDKWLGEPPKLIQGDLLDQSSLVEALKTVRPDVVYNLGAVTFVGMSWQQPALMTDVTGVGVLRLLEAVRMVNPLIRVVQASSSEMFGNGGGVVKDEATPLAPRSPYGVAKAFAHMTVVNYRESYGLHCSAAIMFNHESPLRGEAFVTQKVCTAAARHQPVALGRLDTARDWGWAPDYMLALPLMAERATPRDYVLATGEAHTVQALCAMAYSVEGLDWREYVSQDDRMMRPADIDQLCGNAARASDELGWRPAVRFPELVLRMVKAAKW